MRSQNLIDKVNNLQIAIGNSISVLEDLTRVFSAEGDSNLETAEEIMKHLNKAKENCSSLKETIIWGTN